MTVSLRNYQPSDIQCLKDIRTDYELQHTLMASPAQADQLDIEGWIQRRVSNGVFKIIDDNLGNAVGFVQVHQIHHKSRYGWLGIALHSTARGKGMGHSAMRALHRLAKTDLHLRKLLLEVRSDNFTAIKLYEHLGYRTIGNLLEHYFDGQQHHDVILMEKMLISE